MGNPWLFVEEGSTITALDPDFTVDPNATNPSPTQPGPDRVTMFVPTDQTLINFGAPFPGTTPEGQDGGIAGRTERHIHLHTMDAQNYLSGPATGEGRPFAPYRSIVRLGVPTTTAPATGTLGNQWLRPYALVPSMHNEWEGYSMLTEGGALQESRATHVLASTRGEVRVAGQSVVQLGTPGNVYVYANEHAKLQFFMEDVIKEGSLPHMLQDGNVETERKVEKVIRTVVSGVNAFFSQFMLMEEMFRQRYARSPLVQETGWQAMGISDGFGTSFKAAAAILSKVLIGMDLATDPGASGRVSLYGSSNVASYAGITTSVHSGLATTVSADFAVIMSGTVVASVSSLVYAGMSGTLASVSGTASAKLSSQLGSAAVIGRTGVEVTSGDGGVSVTGQKKVQLNSIDEGVYIHGTEFYLGAGRGGPAPSGPYTARNYQPGVGYAIRGEAEKITISKVTYANRFYAPWNSDAPADDDYYKSISLDDNRIELLHGTKSSYASVRVSNSGLDIFGNGNVNCTIKFRRVLLED